MARVLVGCETSGIVRTAFEAEGHDAYSCDLEPDEGGSNRHLLMDIREALVAEDWDLLVVCHPPCTRLCASGVRWLTAPPRGRTLEDMWRDLDEGAALFSDCWNARVGHIAVENPVMHRHAKARIRNYRPFAQSVQPWQFADDPDGPDNVKKRTCLWLRNLPPLTPTGSLDGSSARDEIARMPQGRNRARLRARSFPGMAAAMARQWGAVADGDDPAKLAA